jgi:hypothetical protein
MWNVIPFEKEKKTRKLKKSCRRKKRKASYAHEVLMEIDDDDMEKEKDGKKNSLMYLQSELSWSTN